MLHPLITVPLNMKTTYKVQEGLDHCSRCFKPTRTKRAALHGALPGEGTQPVDFLEIFQKAKLLL